MTESRRGPGTRRWRAVGATLTALVVLGGGLYLWAWLGGKQAAEQQTFEQPVDRIELDLRGTDLVVTAGEPGRVRVDRELRWAYGKPVVRERWEGRTLRVTSECPSSPRMPGCSVRYRLRVPPTVAIEARAASGSTVVRDVGGDLRLSSSSGDITVVNAAGLFWARTDSGSVTATGLRSPDVDIACTSGGAVLRFAGAPSTVTAKVRSGDLDIEVPAGDPYVVQAMTKSGERDIGVRQDVGAARTIKAETASGDLRLVYGG